LSTPQPATLTKKVSGFDDRLRWVAGNSQLQPLQFVSNFVLNSAMATHLTISDKCPSETSTKKPCDARDAENSQLTSACLLKLPTELLLEVAKQLEGDNQALAALMRSCKSLKLVAEGLLYTAITIPRSSKYQAPHLVRTLLEKPSHALQVCKISLAINVSSSSGSETTNADIIDITNQTTWISDIRTHFNSLKNRYVDSWLRQVLSGHIPSIAMMLLTLLPRAAQVEVFVYENAAYSAPVNDVSRVLFGIHQSRLFLGRLGQPRPSLAQLRSAFTSALSNVRQLKLLGGNLNLLLLPFDSLDVLEIDLGAEFATATPGITTRINTVVDRVANLWSHSRHIPRLNTLVLHSDCCEFLPDLGLYSKLPHFLAGIERSQLQQLEVYIKWSPRKASTKHCSFVHLLDSLGGDLVERLKIDYVDGSDFRPKDCLGDFSRATSLSIFPRLKDFTILQEAIISRNYQRSLDWEWDVASFFPCLLETLTIVCPTAVTLRWLGHLQLARLSGAMGHLRKITLLCRCGHGASTDDFNSDAADQCFGALMDVGILVEVVEETPGAFAKKARKDGSVWEAEWAEHGWTDAMFGVDR
jgi:hypothetical protein